MANKRGLIIIIGMLILGSFVWTQFALMIGNSLELHSQWYNPKAEENLTPFAPSKALLNSWIPLRGNALNLAEIDTGLKWFTQRTATNFSRASFRFKIEQNAYVTFQLSNDEEKGFSAFRFSRNDSYPTGFLKGRSMGEYRQPLQMVPASIIEGGWNEVTVERNSALTTYYLNSKKIFDAPTEFQGPVKVSFGAAKLTALLDDIHLVGLQNETLLKEDFSNPHGFWSTFILIFFLGLLWTIYFLTNWADHYHALGFNLVGVSFAILAYVLAFKHGPIVTAPLLNKFIKEKEAFYPNLVPKFESYVMAELANPTYHEAKIRVLVLGASFNVLGARFGHRWSNTLEAKLKEKFPTLGIKVLDGSIPTSSPVSILPLVEKVTKEWTPHLAVAIFGRQGNQESFEKGIERFLEFNKKHRIKTLLVLQPAPSSDLAEDRQVALLPDRHATTRRLGQSWGVPVLSIDEEINGPKLKDSGLIWWDSGHVTEYGHQLVAQLILPSVVKELGIMLLIQNL